MGPRERRSVDNVTRRCAARASSSQSRPTGRSLIGMRVTFGLVGSGAQLIFRRGVILGVVLAPERAHLHVLLPDP